MDKILAFDIAFLVIFCITLVLFLYRNKKNLSRDGVIFMYRTKLGLKAIDKFSKKNEKLIRKLKYPVIVLGFILMIIIIALLSSNVYSYVVSPKQTIEMTNGAPPIAPLIPYFPKIFGLESMFPDFYFAYFIIALAIVAVVHEFSHGVFMKTFGVKVKSTGFLFLGPILGAFVEEGKSSLEKKKNSEQMAILGAGVFANILFAILFFVLLILFFNVSHSPSGYVFSDYVRVGINTSAIVSFSNYSENLVEVHATNKDYIIPKTFYESFSEDESLLDGKMMIIYEKLPAVTNELRGAVQYIDGERIRNLNDFQRELATKSAGQEVKFETIYKGEKIKFNITLTENPTDDSKPFLGVEHPGSINSGRNFFSRIISSILFFKDPSIYYEANFNPAVVEFIYYLLWWVALINLFVAMFNMLPLGILDGGRFLYLFFLSITKSEKKTKKIYKFIFSTIITIFLLLILGWAVAKFIK